MLRVLLFILIMTGCQSKPQFEFQSGDIYITGANIITVDDSFSIQNDMVIRDGTIAYVGSTLQSTELKDITVLTSNGQTIMPGLIEAHTHPAASAGLYKWLDVSGFKYSTAEEALDAIQTAANTLPDGEWIFAFGWDAMLLKGAYPPYKDVLDRITKKHPIWIMMQSMHSH